MYLPLATPFFHRLLTHLGLFLRKRRCNAGKPSCQNCIEAQVNCEYDDAPSQRIDTSGGSREILSRLRDIEALLEAQSDSLLSMAGGFGATTSSRPATTTTTTAGISSDSSNNGTNHAATAAVPDDRSLASLSTSHMGVPMTPLPLTNIDIAEDLAGVPPLTIPVKHKTSSSYLLSLPAMKALIGEYPPDLFFLLESRDPLPPPLALDAATSFSTQPRPLPPLGRDVTDYLVSAFFSMAHESHPVLDEAEFRALYARFRADAGLSSIENALCMVVLAIGAVAVSAPGAADFRTNPPGMDYMQHALPTLVAQSAWSFSYSTILAQALVLASNYFAFIVRPLHSWRLIFSASTILQFKLSGLEARQIQQSPAAHEYESLLRLFWSCFLLECDRLAELELPRSSLQQLTDETALPSCDSLSPLQSTCYLAEISIRRLLNRIHNCLYPVKQHLFRLSSAALMTTDNFTMEEITAMQTVCDELRRQLDLWHASIPEPYRPLLNTVPEGHTDRQLVLRIRYFAARHIIYRPFVLYIVSTPPTATLPESIREKAALCIDACRSYILNVTHIIQRPSQYTWTFSLSSLAAVVVVTLSSLCPLLKHLVPDIDELQTVAIRNIRSWHMSSLEAVVSILEDMQRKQRILSRV
ncbi:hypothetical protein HMPREF1624_07670 [Sporothrix schenckii ATCC 58251]|uniref:Zn(2)-C6 fungal-type domain-containing protein n=1 Tax=Sporothrix schenckii (strain ATCC 58251 / de Perez 2211183) TaxID=1391915 RepID=U7PN10_SPOS1|nr:hypothetical protein HMPREF1624_07670 [Sporothrix schenckii ATCC 58251]